MHFHQLYVKIRLIEMYGNVEKLQTIKPSNKMPSYILDRKDFHFVKCRHYQVSILSFMQCLTDQLMSLSTHLANDSTYDLVEYTQVTIKVQLENLSQSRFISSTPRFLQSANTGFQDHPRTKKAKFQSFAKPKCCVSNKNGQFCGSLLDQNNLAESW